MGHAATSLAKKSFGFEIGVDAWIKQYAVWCSTHDKTLILATIDLVGNQGLLNQALSVARILAALILDINLLIAGFVYESFSKNKISSLTIEQVLCFTVNKLVLGTQKMQLDLDLCKTYKDEVATKQYNSLETLLTSTENIQIILLKIAIQPHTMRTSINAHAKTKLCLARQTQQLYIFLAKRLNIGQVVWALQDLAFKVLRPRIYKKIATLLDGRCIEREDYIFKIKQQLKECLKLYGIEGKIHDRAKHITVSGIKCGAR